jgi:hypothetical protein
MPDFNMPSYLEKSSPKLINDLGDRDPRGSYKPVPTLGCKDLHLEEHWRLGGSDVEPTSTLENEAIWNAPVGTDEIDVVYTRRNAEAKGNRAIAFAGFLGALSIGFMPIAYDALRQWWRRQRLQAMSGANNASWFVTSPEPPRDRLQQN